MQGVEESAENRFAKKRPMVSDLLDEEEDVKKKAFNGAVLPVLEAPSASTSQQIASWTQLDDVISCMRRLKVSCRMPQGYKC